MTAMTDAACRPLRTLAPITEPERFDRLAELLECMADLLVEVRRRRHRSLWALERSLGDVGLEAASVHQLLQHVHLV